MTHFVPVAGKSGRSLVLFTRYKNYNLIDYIKGNIIWFNEEISYQIFPIIWYWFWSLLLSLFFIINENTYVRTNHTIASNHFNMLSKSILDPLKKDHSPCYIPNPIVLDVRRCIGKKSKSHGNCAKIQYIIKGNINLTS